jgi:peptide subunit release factor RF-3
VLTAVDSALMVIDVAKGVEERTIKLMEVCRLRDTPIMTFINKLDREGKDPIELLDEVETVLGIQCAPVTWPIGMGQRLKGVVHLLTGEVHLYEPGRNFTRQDSTIFPSIDAPGLAEKIGAQMLADLRDELELVQGASHPFDLEAYRAGKQTPVFFGSGVNNFGVQPLLDFFVEHAPRRRRAHHRPRDRPGREQADRLRVQDPGQHGPAAPRPRRLHARLLGPLQRRHEDLPRAHRQGNEAGQRADLHGQRPRDRRRSGRAM